MAFNPSKRGEPLAPPTNSRKNNTNDPGFENRQGYYPYDLSHTEVIAPLFGHITPSMHLVTNMGDRHVVKDETKTILNKINGNFLNTVNQYIDTVFVSNRTMFPVNWDKLIPNPVKGDDLPHSARPVVPLYAYFTAFYNDTEEFEIIFSEGVDSTTVTNRLAYQTFENWDINETVEFYNAYYISYALANASFLAYMLSRGQLLDYLGIQFDFARTRNYETSFQYRIDTFFDAYWAFVEHFKIPFYDFELSPTSNTIDWTNFVPTDNRIPTELSQFRDMFMSAFEAGRLFLPFMDGGLDILGTDEGKRIFQNLIDAFGALARGFDGIFGYTAPSIAEVNAMDDFNDNGQFISLMKPLAYQLSVAQYYTNDTVDNIFTSDLYMQLLRGTMYPSIDGITSEPTFDYNGVPTEYDYISYGGFYKSLLNSNVPGINSRRFLFGSLMLIMRRSLRYGDKFTTGRTRMLALGQLNIPIDETENGMIVNPVNVVLSLVVQRYANAVNRIGNKPLDYYASINGVVPSDLPSVPRYVIHRKIELENRVTTNTANDQGEQTTNLVGYSDDNAFDVFIDDYGILLSLNSYDVLPIYNSGIDSENFMSDRYEFFNPMMQNIGDQPIRATELIGYPRSYTDNFAWVVRNAEYKYKLSKSHGVLCYNMPGYLLNFPTYAFDEFYTAQPLEHIDPDFIRDKPCLLDSVIKFETGVSPGRYFHFIVSVHNVVKSARLIQKAPGLLF